MDEYKKLVIKIEEIEKRIYYISKGQLSPAVVDSLLSLADQLETIKQRLNATNTRVLNLEIDNTASKNTIRNLKTSVNELISNFNVMDLEIRNVKTKADDNLESIKTMFASVSNLETTYNEFKEDIASLETSINSVSARVKALEDAGQIVVNYLVVYPVGSIYESTENISPASFVGGSWERFGNGKVLVGVNEGESEFSEVNKSGGSKYIQSHTHAINDPGHHHNIHARATGGGSYNRLAFTSGSKDYTSTDVVYSSTTGISIGNPNNVSVGSGQNLQPYITVYRWRRIA